MVEYLNRQRVLFFLDVFYAGDLEGALARCSDDIVLVAPAPVDVLPHMGRRHGKDEVRKTWQTVHACYSGMRHEIREMVAEDHKVAMNIRAFFRKRSNGRTVQFDIAVFFTLRDGRISEIREIMDTFDLVQQVLERDLLTGKDVDET
ncbi:MAG TPA: nuclear transport factor 2 family protein [Bradyrhizobium sp.]|nr:nuclear transport factor 2 family protein [Bradyrhizobium sp.]